MRVRFFSVCAQNEIRKKIGQRQIIIYAFTSRNCPRLMRVPVINLKRFGLSITHPLTVFQIHWIGKFGLCMSTLYFSPVFFLPPIQVLYTQMVERLSHYIFEHLFQFEASSQINACGCLSFFEVNKYYNDIIIPQLVGWSVFKISAQCLTSPNIFKFFF